MADEPTGATDDVAQPDLTHEGGLIPLRQAHRGGDPRLVMAAHIVEWLTRSVPASLTLFYGIDRRRLKFADEVVVSASSHAAALDLEWTLSRYRQRFHELDPLAPERVAASGASVFDLGGVREHASMLQSPYVREFLTPLGMYGQTTILFRQDGRLIAGADLLRSCSDPDVTSAQLARLRADHALLEHAYVCAMIAAGRRGREDATARFGLTRRELEVARLVAQGASNDEIARALHISQATVKTHLAHAFEKLQVRSRLQLAALLSSGDRL